MRDALAERRVAAAEEPRVVVVHGERELLDRVVVDDDSIGPSSSPTSIASNVASFST